MAKRGSEEITKEEELEGAMVVVEEDEKAKEKEKKEEEAHPFAFHVSGPRNVATPNWRDLINSSWSVNVFPCSSFFLSCMFGFMFLDLLIYLLLYTIFGLMKSSLNVYF